MKKDIADKWVVALRSGKYKQANGVLKDSDGSYCCLGVLCELVKKEVNLDWKKDGHFWEFDDESGELPKSVMEYVEMNSELGNLDDLHAQSLSELNDKGMNFNEIASIIEEEWEDL